MKKILEKFVLFLHKKYGITPNILTYVRIFAAPWIALLISKVLTSKSLILTTITLVLYLLVASTDFLDGVLARTISKEKIQDQIDGEMFDRISDKILIIFILIPFGLNLYTFSIILAESILAFHALNSAKEEKQATKTGKIKMALQVFLIPLLILQATTSFIPEMVLYLYIIITIVYTYMSLFSHYFYFGKN